MTPGSVLNEKYRLVEQIGEGGMATVWRAVQISLDRPVAVKFISAIGPSASKYVERFLAEAKLAAAIRHRNVIDILDFGTTDEGTAYMVLELLEGESLADRMARLPALALGEIVNIAVLVLSGLQAVHNAGVVHRDLKPENVFLVSDDDGVFPKLLDFGVSKSVDRRDGRGAPLTQEGVLVGTPQYMAPEQARGLRDVDHRIDLWAMGVILYEVLAGKLPYDSENVGDILIQIVSQDAPPITFYRPEVGPELSAVVQRAMSRNRDERFQDAKEMRAAIMEAAAKMGDAAGMWGRITPGSGLIHHEALHTPISGLIQVVAVEHARAVQRSAAASAASSAITGEQGALSDTQAADALAKTMPAMMTRERIATPSTSAPIGRRDPTDDVRLVRTSIADDVAAPSPKPRRAQPTPAPRGDVSESVDLPDVPEPKKSSGAVWVFLGILLVGGGAAAALALNPALLDRLSELVGGGGALPEQLDAGAAALDAGPPDLGEPDLGPPDLGPPDLGEPDLGPPDLGPADAGGDDAGVDEDGGAELDAGSHDEIGAPTKRPTKRRWVRRPIRRPGKQR